MPSHHSSDNDNGSQPRFMIGLPWEIFPEKYCATAKRNFILTQKYLVNKEKERQQASSSPSSSKAAPSASSSSSLIPKSYLARLATFTSSWPHIIPSAIVMAQAGFYQVHGPSTEHDRVKCSECGISISGWKPCDNPAKEYAHETGCSWFRGASSSYTRNICAMPLGAMGGRKELGKGLRTDTTAVPKIHIDEKREDELAKDLVLPMSMEVIPLDEGEDWVDLGFEGEEDDGWVEV